MRGRRCRCSIMQDVQISLSWCRGRFPWSGLVGPQRFLQLLHKVIDVPVGSSMVQKLWLSRSCSSSKIVDFLFVPQRQLPMVPPFRKTMEFLQLLYVVWLMPVMHVVFHAPCCTTGAHGSDSAELCGSAAVAVPSWL